MPGSAIGLNMDMGYAGSETRQGPKVVKAKPVYSGSNAIPFGAAVVQRTDNTYTNADGHTDTLSTTNFAGFAFNEVKQGTELTIGQNAQTGQYVAGQVADVLAEGVILVQLADATSITAGGAVYVRKTLNTGTYPDEVVGSIRASADSTNTVQLPNAVFETGKVGANNMAEVRLKYPNV